ncbi:uncharacterized protein [Saccopteryx leptura]|uniref:uncharacterized protein n=1 Tax=Saccopteryx leptura TaxID=249018 RepID=UPI00339C5A1C
MAAKGFTKLLLSTLLRLFLKHCFSNLLELSCCLDFPASTGPPRPRAPLPICTELPGGDPRGARWASGAALRPRPPCPRPAAPWKAGHPALAPTAGGPRTRSRCRQLDTPVCGRAVASQRSWDCGQRAGGPGREKCSHTDSLRSPGSRLPVPPRGAKTAGAAAPAAAAAACSWRARAAVAAAADSWTRTAGCLGLPRCERWAPARPPSHPPRREPQQLRRPGPIRQNPRSQDRGTLLPITEEDSAYPSPPSPRKLQCPAACQHGCAGANTPRPNVCVSVSDSMQSLPCLLVEIATPENEDPRWTQLPV